MPSLNIISSILCPPYHIKSSSYYINTVSPFKCGVLPFYYTGIIYIIYMCFDSFRKKRSICREGPEAARCVPWAPCYVSAL